MPLPGLSTHRKKASEIEMEDKGIEKPEYQKL